MNPCDNCKCKNEGMGCDLRLDALIAEREAREKYHDDAIRIEVVDCKRQIKINKDEA